MAFRTSLRKRYHTAPTNDTVPAAADHMDGLINAIEADIVFKSASLAAANDPVTGFSPFLEGMVLVTTSAPKEMYIYVDGAWKKIWPTNYSGDNAPLNSLGIDGDTYDEY